MILTTGELIFTLPEGSARQSVTKVEVHLSAGACGLYIHRFTMIPDEKNLQHLQEGGWEDLYRLFLEDSLARIKSTRNLRDWTSTETLVDSAVCDKEHPEKSLFHAMALKAGVPPGEIDCVSIPHFEDWTNHTLSTHKEPRRRFVGKTQHGLFYPRVGARTYLSIETGETPLTRVTELILTYSLKEGFTAQITLEEEKES